MVDITYRARHFSKRIGRLIDRSMTRVSGAIRGDSVSAYWWDDRDNFGDMLTPEVLRYYGYTPIHCSAERADILCTGSILHLAPDDYSGNIIGSGLIEDVRRDFDKATVWAVRGELTRDRIGAPLDTPLGDPGLLSPLLFDEAGNVEFELGIVPHYRHRNNPILNKLSREYGQSALVIDAASHPKDVFRDISRCGCILSSSLHGLIFADSLGIPNVRAYIEPSLIGGDFKFNDYWSALEGPKPGLELDGDERLSTIVGSATVSAGSVDDQRESLNNAFLLMKEYMTSA